MNKFENDIIQAVANGDIEKVKHWIARGIDILYFQDECENGLLTVALQHGQTEMAKLLRESIREIIRDSELGFFIKRRMQLIREEGENGETIIRTLNKEEQELHESFMEILKEDDPLYSLMQACTFYYPELLEELLDRGADINFGDEYGCTPLISALINGYLDIVEELLYRGADVNVKDKKGRTALKIAKELATPPLEKQFYSIFILKAYGAKE